MIRLSGNYLHYNLNIFSSFRTTFFWPAALKSSSATASSLSTKSTTSGPASGPSSTPHRASSRNWPRQISDLMAAAALPTTSSEAGPEDLPLRSRFCTPLGHRRAAPWSTCSATTSSTGPRPLLRTSRSRLPVSSLT